MSRQILPTRIHPFIVAEIKPFLEALGYTPLKHQGSQSLDTLACACDGAIISLAVTSSTDLKAEEVLKRVRSTALKLPLLFAGLISFEKYQKTLVNRAQQTGLSKYGLAVSAETEISKRLGSPHDWLYISKDYLLEPKHRRLAARLFKHHFR